ncbi:MAG: hypothetical protein ACRD0X_07420 [Thermoanaerobaculia bacterium]
MGGVNRGRVILGGLVAGAVINLGEFICNELLFGEKWRAAMAALGKTMPTGGKVIAVWLLWGFLLGLGIVWLYAAIRPRYGAGPRTAVCAGVAAWFLVSLLGSLAMCNMDLVPRDLLAMTSGWSLVEYLLASLAGAWVYKEA